MGYPPQGTSGFAGALRIFAFVDGCYLTSNLKKMFDDPYVNHPMLVNRLEAVVSIPSFRSLLIRLYYYDAISNDKAVTDEQKTRHEQLKNTDLCELRLGRIKEVKKGTIRQKGVDTLLAIDMISKAYQNHYDVAVLFAGDDDFVDVVKSVKNAGKQVYGVYFDKVTSQELKDSFDKRIPIEHNDHILLNIRHKPKEVE
jgi:uncharacterized LabA/DUF88 family protein